jgi:hypothetical protein
MNNLKFPFRGHELIEAGCGQAGQDLFVLGILDGKTNGTYLEIGAGPAVETSNSYVLEKYYGWRGASVEISRGWYDEHKRFGRKHHIELQDARTMDYPGLLLRAGITVTDIDYASVDCEPPSVTFDVLTKLPFDTHRFAVLTFEHDCYAWGDDIKIRSREFMESKGYELIVSNISPMQELGDFEDWYVHPDLVSREVIDRFKAADKSIKLWNKYLLL